MLNIPEQSGEFWIRVGPLQNKLILSDLTNSYTFHSTSGDSLNHSNKLMFPLAHHYLDLKNGVSNYLLDFYENLNKTTGNIKQKVVDIFFKYKLDFAYLYLYWQTVQILNAGKSIQC